MGLEFLNTDMLKTGLKVQLVTTGNFVVLELFNDKWSKSKRYLLTVTW